MQKGDGDFNQGTRPAPALAYALCTGGADGLNAGGGAGGGLKDLWRGLAWPQTADGRGVAWSLFSVTFSCKPRPWSAKQRHLFAQNPKNHPLSPLVVPALLPGDARPGDLDGAGGAPRRAPQRRACGGGRGRAPVPEEAQEQQPVFFLRQPERSAVRQRRNLKIKTLVSACCPGDTCRLFLFRG